MWYLTSDTDQRIIYITTPNKEVTIGRTIESQNCDFAISDPSISRRHATLLISNDCLTLQDLGSKYGTFINNFSEKVDANARVQLKVGDVIKFGKFTCIWKTHKIDFVTCTSTLKGENLQNLKSSLGKLGGTLKSDWDDSCIYLTMPGITLTIKVVLALVQGSSIVSTDFWLKCVEAVDSNSVLPDPKDFTPQVIESTLNKELVSFLPNKKRRELFNHKKFIFFSKRQLDMYKTVLEKSSASALLLSESNMTKSMLCEKDVIVIQFNLTIISQETQAQRDQINEIVSYLKTKNKRLVADAEIGLAILYCSIDKYCNPSFNFPSEIIKQPAEQSCTKTNILAPESQETSNRQIKVENIVINESLTSQGGVASLVTNSSSKRKLCEGDYNSNASKKIATVTNVAGDSSKRKFEEESGTSEMNPRKKVAVETDDNNDEDFFNFVDNKSIPNPVEKETTSANTLNFSSLLQKKQDVVNNDDDEDLFNFIEEKKPDVATLDQQHKTNISAQQKSVRSQQTNKNIYETGNEVDIKMLRGIKLKELQETNSNYNTYSVPNIKTIKTEVTDELGETLSNLDLGTTIVKFRSDLIVKKESLEIEARNSEVKNFKKFKKVWPVKMQVTIIPKSTTDTSHPDSIKDTSTVA